VIIHFSIFNEVNDLVVPSSTRAVILPLCNDGIYTTLFSSFGREVIDIGLNGKRLVNVHTTMIVFYYPRLCLLLHGNKTKGCKPGNFKQLNLGVNRTSRSRLKFFLLSLGFVAVYEMSTVGHDT
jgi:hypothetical protein